MINNTHLHTQKFVARKARKFALQGHRLALPALEMAYLFLGITHAPRSVIVNKMLPEVDGLLARLDGAEYRESEAGGGKGKGKWKSDKDIEKVYGGGKGGYWDDYCLAMFLRGVCLRYLAYPVSFFFAPFVLLPFSSFFPYIRPLASFTPASRFRSHVRAHDTLDFEAS